MSTRDEHLRLSATYMNIAAAGILVACVATVPLGALTSGRLTDWTIVDMMVICLFISAAFHGIAQLILVQVES